MSREATQFVSEGRHLGKGETRKRRGGGKRERNMIGGGTYPMKAKKGETSALAEGKGMARKAEKSRGSPPAGVKNKIKGEN